MSVISPSEFVSDFITEHSYVNGSAVDTDHTFDISDIDFTSICHMSLDNLGHCLVFFTFTLIGVIGNVALLFSILVNKHLQSTPNIFIVNLTVADLVYMLATAPFNIRHELTACWRLGVAACKIKHYIPIVAQGACVFSLTALSRERYTVIVKGFESRAQKSARRTLIIVTLCWLAGALIGIPVLIITTTNSFGLLCSYMPMDDKRSKGYMLFLFMSLYVIPFILIAIHYVQLARTLWQNNVVNLADNQSIVRQLQARKRLALIVMTITILFGMFWFPYHVYHMFYMFTKNQKLISGNHSHMRYFRHLYNYMSLANSCINPWIVFLMSSAHRSSLVNCFGRVTCISMPRKIMRRNQPLKMSISTSSNYYTSSTTNTRM